MTWIYQDEVVLNIWVETFKKALERSLRLYQLESCLQEGKVILTPYGGRIEYSILDHLLIGK